MKETALKWIVDLLNKRKIPFSICGGLAANFYGSSRPLQDIDLFIPHQYFYDVVKAGADYLSKPAHHYCNKAEGWDLVYVQFLYCGVKIEVGSAKDVKIFNAASSQWQTLEIDFENTVKASLFDLPVSIMPLADLIGYKTLLGRSVDIEDIEAIKK